MLTTKSAPHRKDRPMNTNPEYTMKFAAQRNQRDVVAAAHVRRAARSEAASGYLRD